MVKCVSVVNQWIIGYLGAYRHQKWHLDFWNMREFGFHDTLSYVFKESVSTVLLISYQSISSILGCCNYFQSVLVISCFMHLKQNLLFCCSYKVEHDKNTFNEMSGKYHPTSYGSGLISIEHWLWAVKHNFHGGTWRLCTPPTTHSRNSQKSYVGHFLLIGETAPDSGETAHYKVSALFPCNTTNLSSWVKARNK